MENYSCLYLDEKHKKLRNLSRLEWLDQLLKHLNWISLGFITCDCCLLSSWKRAILCSNFRQ